MRSPSKTLTPEWNAVATIWTLLCLLSIFTPTCFVLVGQNNNSYHETRPVKEPVGLVRLDGKRPDGTTVLPWFRGKPRHGTSQCLTHLRTHVWPIQPDRQVLQPLRQRITRSPSADLQSADDHTRILSGGRNGRNLASSGGGADTDDRQANDHHHRWHKGDRPLVPAVVCGTTERKHGLFSKYVYCRIARSTVNYFLSVPSKDTAVYLGWRLTLATAKTSQTIFIEWHLIFDFFSAVFFYCY